jgi:hypothetical protein
MPEQVKKVDKLRGGKVDKFLGDVMYRAAEYALGFCCVALLYCWNAVQLYQRVDKDYVFTG